MAQPWGTRAMTGCGLLLYNSPTPPSQPPMVTMTGMTKSDGAPPPIGGLQGVPLGDGTREILK